MEKDCTKNEKVVIEFLNMVANRSSSSELDKFYHPEIQQIEYPNAVLKATAFRNLQDLKDGAERGKSIMSGENYAITQLHSFGDIVVLEAIWTGTIAVNIGNLKAGEHMKAYFAQFFEFKDGKIYRQRNYDCFEPFN